MEQGPILRLDQIRKSFFNVNALKGVSLELRKGEVLALMGENGAGKSTLMNILQGAVGDYEGSIFLRNKQVEIHSPVDARKLGIAKIHQELQLVPELTVAENIFLGREPRNRFGLVDYQKMNKETNPYLEALDLSVKETAKVGGLPSRGAAVDRGCQGAVTSCPYFNHGRTDIGLKRSRDPKAIYRFNPPSERKTVGIPQALLLIFF